MCNLERDATNIEAMIMAIMEDSETMALVKKMKEENAPELIELSKLPKEEIMGGIKQVVDDMIVLDVLFQDNERAVVEMEKEGMIPEDLLAKYKKNPELLEEGKDIIMHDYLKQFLVIAFFSILWNVFVANLFDMMYRYTEGFQNAVCYFSRCWGIFVSPTT